MIMKTLKYITLVLGISLFSSCLDEEPKYSMDNGVQFSNESNAKMALDGCYGYMTTHSVYGHFYTELTIGASGFAWFTTNGSYQDDYVSLRARLSDDLNQGVWEGLYKVVNETNTFIANVADSPLDNSVKVTMTGQAKFLRALAYYNLATIWGDVPYKIAASAIGAVELPRTPKAQIFAQCESDWTDAFNTLPETVTDGYGSKWAAKAFLGKLYHTMACQGDETAWQKAKECFDAVYGKFALESKFQNLFVDNVNNSKESIFQLNYTTTSDYNKSRLHWVFSARDCGVGVAWARTTITKSFYDKFRGTYPGDPRIDGTFFSKWRKYQNGAPKAQMFKERLTANDSSYCYPYFVYASGEQLELNNGTGKKQAVQMEDCIPYDEVSDPTNPSYDELSSGDIPNGKRVLDNFANKSKLNAYQTHWPIIKKYFDQAQVGQNAHKNIIVYRYAEMLLDMADVYNELGNTDKAISLANEVLKRARQSVTDATQPADWKSGLSKDALREKIYFERLFETCSEPGQYQRARIWGTRYDLFKHLLEVNNNHSITQKVYELGEGKVNFSERRFGDNGVLTESFLKKNLLLPICQKELNTNSAIKPTDNNFGY